MLIAGILALLIALALLAYEFAYGGLQQLTGRERTLAAWERYCDAKRQKELGWVGLSGNRELWLIADALLTRRLLEERKRELMAADLTLFEDGNALDLFDREMPWVKPCQIFVDREAKTTPERPDPDGVSAAVPQSRPAV